MDASTRDDQDKLRRYITQRACATGRSEFTVLLEIQVLLDVAVPELTRSVAMREWRRVRAAVDAEYDDRYGLRPG